MTTDTFAVPQASFIGRDRLAALQRRRRKFVDVTYNQEDDLGSTNCVLHGFAISN